MLQELISIKICEIFRTVLKSTLESLKIFRLSKGGWLITILE